MDESESEKSEKSEKSESIFGPLFFFNLRYIKGEVRGNNLMGVKSGTCWRNFREFSKSPSWREFLKNILKSNFLEKM